MKNPFKSKGFDTLISKNTIIDGMLFVCSGESVQVDGNVRGAVISSEDVSAISAGDTLLFVSGNVNSHALVEVHNVTITGTVRCKVIRVKGQLSIKDNGVLIAEEIYYGSLVVEQDASINGSMKKIEDH